MQTGPAVFPPSERQLPGFGTTAEPPDSPDWLQDRHSYADMRLSGMWGAQEYFGPKPGRQTGSLISTANRDIRQPLPTASPVGGMSGPTNYNGWSIGAGGMWTGPALFPEPRYPFPSWGPKPGLANCDSDEDQAAGRPHRRIPAVQGEEMNEEASSSDATNENSDSQSDGTGGGGKADSDDCDPRNPGNNDAMEDAMNAQNSWLDNLFERVFGDRVYDEGEPDSFGETVWNTVLPVADLGKKAYRYVNNKLNGELDTYYDSLSNTATYAMAGAAIGTSVAIGAALVVGAVVSGAVAAVAAGVEAAGTWVAGIAARAGAAYLTAAHAWNVLVRNQVYNKLANHWTNTVLPALQRLGLSEKTQAIVGYWHRTLNKLLSRILTTPEKQIELWKNSPIRSLRYYYDYYAGKGLTGNDIWRTIAEKAGETNETINRLYGYKE